LRTSPASYRNEPFCLQRPRTSLETCRPMDLGGGGIVHATKFGQQAAAGYIAATHNAATDSLSNLYATRRIFLCGWR
jgi:hypothetical protein